MSGSWQFGELAHSPSCVREAFCWAQPRRRHRMKSSTCPPLCGTDPARFLGVWTDPGRTRPLDHTELGHWRAGHTHPPWSLASAANSEFSVCHGAVSAQRKARVEAGLDSINSNWEGSGVGGGCPQPFHPSLNIDISVHSNGLESSLPSARPVVT